MPRPAATRSAKKGAKGTTRAASVAPPAVALPPPAPPGSDPFGGGFDLALSACGDPGDRPWHAARAATVIAPSTDGPGALVLDELSVCLAVDVSTQPISTALFNECARPGALIRSVGWSEPAMHVPDPRSEEERAADWELQPDGAMRFVGAAKSVDECFRTPTTSELDALVTTHAAIVLQTTRAKMRDGQPFARRYLRANGWRVRDVMTAVLELERYARPCSEWFGGVDAHHTYFEGVAFSGHVGRVMFGS